jgi:ferritin
MLKTLNPKTAEILMKKISKEYLHHYTYQAASNWCRDNGFDVAKDFFLKESDEELGHARKLQEYLIDWNMNPVISVEFPSDLNYTNLLELIQTIYNTEYELYEMYEYCSKELIDMGDTCTFDFLQFFRKAQTDAVITYSDMLGKLEGVNGDDKFTMLLLEKKLF